MTSLVLESGELIFQLNRFIYLGRGCLQQLVEIWTEGQGLVQLNKMHKQKQGQVQRIHDLDGAHARGAHRHDSKRRAS